MHTKLLFRVWDIVLLYYTMMLFMRIRLCIWLLFLLVIAFYYVDNVTSSSHIYIVNTTEERKREKTATR
jgi:uncharacterized membrane protein